MTGKRTSEAFPVRTCTFCDAKTTSTSTIDSCVKCGRDDALRPKHFLTRGKDADEGRAGLPGADARAAQDDEAKVEAEGTPGGEAGSRKCTDQASVPRVGPVTRSETPTAAEAKRDEKFATCATCWHREFEIGSATDNLLQCARCGTKRPVPRRPTARLIADRNGDMHDPSDVADRLDGMADRSAEATAEALHDAADVVRGLAAGAGRESPTPDASSECPVCGQNTPHAHLREDIEQWLTNKVAAWGYEARLYSRGVAPPANPPEWYELLALARELVEATEGVFCVHTSELRTRLGQALDDYEAAWTARGVAADCASQDQISEGSSDGRAGGATAGKPPVAGSTPAPPAVTCRADGCPEAPIDLTGYCADHPRETAHSSSDELTKENGHDEERRVERDGDTRPGSGAAAERSAGRARGDRPSTDLQDRGEALAEREAPSGLPREVAQRCKHGITIGANCGKCLDAKKRQAGYQEALSGVCKWLRSLRQEEWHPANVVAAIEAGQVDTWLQSNALRTRAR